MVSIDKLHSLLWQKDADNPNAVGLYRYFYSDVMQLLIMLIGDSSSTCGEISLERYKIYMSYFLERTKLNLTNSHLQWMYSVIMTCIACLPQHSQNRSSGLIRNSYILRLGLANIQDERFTPFLVIKIKGNDCEKPLKVFCETHGREGFLSKHLFGFYGFRAPWKTSCVF
jgi:hypothetical protein